MLLAALFWVSLDNRCHRFLGGESSPLAMEVVAIAVFINRCYIVLLIIGVLGLVYTGVRMTAARYHSDTDIGHRIYDSTTHSCQADWKEDW